MWNLIHECIVMENRMDTLEDRSVQTMQKYLLKLIAKEKVIAQISK
jgi:hypothetical protein